MFGLAIKLIHSTSIRLVSILIGLWCICFLGIFAIAFIGFLYLAIRRTFCWCNIFLFEDTLFSNIICGLLTGIISSILAGKISGKTVWRNAKRELESEQEKNAATPEDVFIFIEQIDPMTEINTADEKTLLKCYHEYKAKAESETGGTLQSFKTLLPHERRLIVTLYNAIRSRSFMGRRFVLCPLDEAKSQAWNNIEYRDFVCAVVSEESGISPTT